MNDDAIEDRLHEFLQEAVDAAEEGHTLHGAENHDTVYTSIGEFGYRIGDCNADVAPLPDGEGMDEFDARLFLICFARVAGQDKTERKAARAKARALHLAAGQLFFGDTTMGGRVGDVLMKRGRRGFDLENDDVYAVVNIPLLINGTGQLIDDEERDF
jgi:hypothetical protein